MSLALDTRSALKTVTGESVDTASLLLSRTSGSPDARRALMLESVPPLIGYYADGSAALATDFYENVRDRAAVGGAFTASPVVVDRTAKIRNAIAWSALPLFDGLEADAVSRLAEVVQYETARPFRNTITANRREDPESIGWRRITVGGCAFCRMLADRGAVYKHSTARFAAHTNCHCTAQPVFKTDVGPEASVMQYRASRRGRTQKQRDSLRSYLKTVYPNIPG